MFFSELSFFFFFKPALHLLHVLMLISVTSPGGGRVDPIPLNIKTGMQCSFFPHLQCI